MGQQRCRVGNCDTPALPLLFGTNAANCPLFIVYIAAILKMENVYAVVIQRKDSCKMENTTSRIIIETLVKKALREIRESPERSIRNLVDMALHFSNDRFHRSFFEMAQAMLQNEDSPYYGLIEDVVCNVDSERLIHFGMNLGYNSCTAGAKTIREIEAKEHYNIPWTILLNLDPLYYSGHRQDYGALISQGEEIGIYTWMLFPTMTAVDFLSLVQEHPDSAFILFCKPKDITLSFLDCVSECTNLMLAVQYDEDTADACELLRSAKLLYSVCSVYTENDVESITGGELFFSIQQLHPVFTILLADSECPDTAKQMVYKAVRQVRNRQEYRTIALEATSDSSFIDSIISNDACLAGFDSEGYLFTLQGSKKEYRFHFPQNKLPHILKLAFPKSNSDLPSA